MHFPIVHVYFFFSIQIKGHLGVKRSNWFLNGPKNQIFFKITKIKVSRVLHGQRSKSVHSDFFVRPTIKGQRKERSKFRTISNNSLNVFRMDRDEKVSTVTSSRDLPLRGKGSKYLSFQLAKIAVLVCWVWTEMQKMSTVISKACSTYGVKVQKGQHFQLCWN